MTTRADRIETVEEIIRSWYWTGDTYTNAERAEEVLDAVLPQITTAEELEALPIGAVILADDGHAWSIEERSDRRGIHGFPLTVVWQPQPEQETT